MTDDQQKIFDEINRSFEEFVKETFGTELAEGAKKMPPQVSDCVKELLSSCGNGAYPASRIEIKDAGNGIVNALMQIPGYALFDMAAKVWHGFLDEYWSTIHYKSEHIPEIERLFAEYVKQKGYMEFTLKIEEKFNGEVFWHLIPPPCIKSKADIYVRSGEFK